MCDHHFQRLLEIFLCMMVKIAPHIVLVEVVHVLGLSSSERRVLGADVALGAGGRLEGHGAAGALVENLAVSGLDVGLDRVQPSEHDLAARAPSIKMYDKKEKEKKQIFKSVFDV